MLRPLSAYQPPRYQPRIVAVAGFVSAAVLYACSMPLQWVGVRTASGRFVMSMACDRQTGYCSLR